MTAHSILENVVRILIESIALGFILFCALGFVVSRLIELVWTAIDLLREAISDC